MCVLCYGNDTLENNPVKGVFHFGKGEATAYSDEEITKINPCPYKVIPGPEKKIDWGNWWTILFWECHGQNKWDPFRSPEQIRFLEKVGYDVVTDIRDTESLSPLSGKTLEILEEDGLDVDRFGSEWVKRTGRGLIPSSLWMTDAGGCDGAVFTGVGTEKRMPATHSSICYSSPNTFHWTVRKVKGLKEAFKNTAVGPDGKFYGYFLKETSRHLYLRSTPTQFYFSCYCTYCQTEFQRYAKKKYGSIEKLSEAYDRKYYNWNDIDLPVPEMRFYEPQKFYDFIKFREWIRMENGDKLWKKLGLNNIVNEGSFQFAAWYIGAFTGTNTYLSARNLDIAYLNILGGFGPCDAIAAMVDSVFRECPEKKAIAEWGGGPSLYLQRPGTFRRKIGEHFGHVTNMRGVAIMGWDTMLRRLFGYYYDPKWCPWVAQDIAWWSNFGELQHWLIKDMKTSRPEIASYFAKPSILFEAIEHAHPEGMHPERSKAWTWNAMMFWQSHLPLHILHPEQIEDGDLSKYKVLYCLYGPRNTPETLKRVREFYDAGGYVYGAFDALTWTIKKEDWSDFKHIFKCEKIEEPWRSPLALSGVNCEPSLKQRIYRWNSNFKEPLGYYEITASHPALPPVGTKLPVTSAIRIVRPLPGAKVHALYNGQPCIVSTEHSLYVGTDIMSDLAHCAPNDYKSNCEPWQLNYPSLPRDEFREMLKVLTGFAEYAGVKPPFEIYKNGKQAININTGTLSKADGTSLYILSNNEDIGGIYEVEIPLQPGWEVADLVSEKRLSFKNGKAEIKIPGYGFAMILMARPVVMEQALQVQQEVNMKTGDILDELEKLSRNFFVQAEASDKFNGLGFPLNWGEYTYPYLYNMNAQAIIVVPDDPSTADQELAQNIRNFFMDYPYLIDSNWQKANAEKKNPMEKLGIKIPIKKAREITADEIKNRNLLCIGNPKENEMTAKLLPDQTLLDNSFRNLFVSYMPNPNEAGGNVFVIGGSPEQRNHAYKKLMDWAWIWFDSLLSPIPPEKIMDIVKNSYQKNGWKILSASNEEVTAEKDGIKQNCVIYCHNLSDPEGVCKLFMKNIKESPTFVVCDTPDSCQHFVKKLIEYGLIEKEKWPSRKYFGTITTKDGKSYDLKFVESDKVGL